MTHAGSLWSRARRLALTSALAASIAAPLAACGPPSHPTPAPAKSPTATPSATPTPAPAAIWPVYHQNPQRSGNVSGTPVPTSLSIAWQSSLDGAVYGEPLDVGGDIIVATENDTLYALNAADGTVVWRDHVGTPVSQGLPCGDIFPLGITGTPAYDPATNSIFAVAEETGFVHVLYAFNASSGAVLWSRRVDVQIPSEYPSAVQQRPALAVANGHVYIGFGGLDGDCSQYRGAVVAVPTDNSGATLQYVVPTTREGAVWATGGPVVGSGGNIFVSVGNGAATSGAWDYTDSVLELSPSLALVAAFAPSRWAYDNAHDLDLGSVSPTLLPNGYIFIAGKSGTGYVVPQSKLGGVGGETFSGTTCDGQMAFGATAFSGDTVYLPCANGVESLTVSATGSFTIGWQTASGANGPPVLAGGAVWSLDTNNGTLMALSQGSGALEQRISVGPVPHFVSPTLIGSTAYVGTDAGVVAVAGA